jgi:uncharacterized protein YaaW (UPF0174 family)
LLEIKNKKLLSIVRSRLEWRSSMEALTEGSIEDGSLLPVLRRASHQDLLEIAKSLDKGADVFLTWDKRYDSAKDDLTRVPEVIGDYLLRAGGHAVANKWRGRGPGYTEVVKDVCDKVSIKFQTPSLNPRAMEVMLLRALMDQALKGLTDGAKADLLEKMKQAAGRPVKFDDLLKGTTLLGLLMPLVFMAIAQQTLVRGVAAGAGLVLGRLAAGVAGPIGLVAGTVWLVSDFAGPSYRATIPAVTQVALLRQKFLWADGL